MQLKRVFVKLGGISKHLRCSLCMEVFIDPQRVQCGHTYCKGCIKGWLIQKILTCPNCREDIDGTLQKDFIAYNLIQDELVLCINEPLCDWSGPLSNLETHSKKCGLKNKKIQNYLQKDDFDKGSEYFDDDLVQRIQHNCPRGTLFQRVYAKHEEQREVMDNLFIQKKIDPTPAEDELDIGFINSLFSFMEPNQFDTKATVIVDGLEQSQKQQLVGNELKSAELRNEDSRNLCLDESRGQQDNINSQLKKEIDQSNNLTEIIDIQFAQIQKESLIDITFEREQEEPKQNPQFPVKQGKYNRLRKPVKVNKGQNKNTI